MATIGFTQQRFPVQITTPLSAPMLVDRIEGEEQLSGLFSFRVWMRAEVHDVDFTQIVGQSVTLKLDASSGAPAYVNGIVARFRQGNTGPRFTEYSAEIVPRVWLLTKAANCRIFQNQSVPDIVKSVLTDHGVTAVEDKTTGSYAAREYCVQYRETDFAFISRLMEDEGIGYYFTHADGQHTMTLIDGADAWAEGPSGMSVGPSASGWERSDAVTDPALAAEVVTEQYQATDYNFTTPETDLFSAASGDSTGLTVYDHPAGPQVKADVETLVKVRLSELDLTGKVLHAASGNPAVRAGSTLTLTDHKRGDLNAVWAIRAMTHQADQKSYANTFDAFPADKAYRPPRVTPLPVIASCQTAKVVGKAGEEIWTDEYGRVKVKFHWDQAEPQDETSSCWIRVAQSWAGLGWGSFYLPRIGQEVVVSFLEGNPDRPLVTGCVYNATNTVPYPLPADQTKSTVKTNSSKDAAGFNEIRFEDKAGAEELFIQAQKEMVITVLGNQRQTVQLNRSLAVAGNEATTVTGTQTLTVTGDVTRTYEGKITEKVDGDYSIEVGGAFTLKVTGDITIATDGKITVTSNGDAVYEAGASLTLKSGAGMTIKAGASLNTEAQASITQKASATQTVEASGPLTLKGAVVQIN